MAEEKCIFCNCDSIKEDILWETDNFFVKVGVGILAPGHVMIIPKEHISCYAELSNQLGKEFISIKEQVFNNVKYNFSEPIIYEHGIYSQSIKHAHLHFVPNKNKFYKLVNLRDNIFKDLESVQISDFFKIRDIFEKEGSYCYLEEKGQKWIFHTKGLPDRKYTFRKEFVKLTGIHGLVDWENMPENEKLRNNGWIKMTKEALKNKFKP